jgi:hypothetical protein
LPAKVHEKNEFYMQGEWNCRVNLKFAEKKKFEVKSLLLLYERQNLTD